MLCRPNESDTAKKGSSTVQRRLPYHHSQASSTSGSITAGSLHLYASQKATKLKIQRRSRHSRMVARQKVAQRTSNTYIGFQKLSNRAMCRPKKQQAADAASVGAPSRRMSVQ